VTLENMCVTHRPILAIGILTNFQPILVHVCDYGVGIYG